METSTVMLLKKVKMGLYVKYNTYMIYDDFRNNGTLSHRHTLNHGVLLSKDKSQFSSQFHQSRLMNWFFPRDEIKKIHISESILGGCAYFIGDIIIDNQADVFVFVASKIVWFSNWQTVEMNRFLILKNWKFLWNLKFHKTYLKMKFKPLYSIIWIIAHPVSFTITISKIVKTMPGHTISKTSNIDSLLATEIDCVACDVGLGNYCRQDCRLHRRLRLFVLVGSIVTVISPIIVAIVIVVIGTNIGSIIILIFGIAT